jgi:hypothetical protein
VFVWQVISMQNPLPEKGKFFWVKNREKARALEAAYDAVTNANEDWVRVVRLYRMRPTQDPIPKELQPFRMHFFSMYGRRNEDQFFHAMRMMLEIATTDWKQWVKIAMGNWQL